jgi:hypothetical protein
MAKDRDDREPLVYRITVDEKLDDDLIRILVAPLRADVDAFDDDTAVWGEETALNVTPDTYAEAFGMTAENAGTYPWEKLQESQVFLRGMFKLNPRWKTGKTFLVEKKRRNFRPVNRYIKDLVKREYLNILERSS